MKEIVLRRQHYIIVLTTWRYRHLKCFIKYSCVCLQATVNEGDSAEKTALHYCTDNLETPSSEKFSLIILVFAYRPQLMKEIVLRRQHYIIVLTTWRNRHLKCFIKYSCVCLQATVNEGDSAEKTALHYCTDNLETPSSEMFSLIILVFAYRPQLMKEIVLRRQHYIIVLTTWRHCHLKSFH